MIKQRLSCPGCALAANKSEGQLLEVGPYSVYCQVCGHVGLFPKSNKKCSYWGKTWEDARKLMEEDGIKPEWE